jgi:hypothetical protein
MSRSNAQSHIVVLATPHWSRINKRRRPRVIRASGGRADSAVGPAGDQDDIEQRLGAIIGRIRFRPPRRDTSDTRNGAGVSDRSADTGIRASTGEPITALSPAVCLRRADDSEPARPRAGSLRPTPLTGTFCGPCARGMGPGPTGPQVFQLRCRTIPFCAGRAGGRR